MKRYLLIISALFTAVGSCGAAAPQDLPPEMQADLYLLEAKRAMEDTVQESPIRRKTAISAFRKIEALNIKPALDYLHFYGRFLIEEMDRSRDLLKGQSLLREYAIKGGKASKHYMSTLELLSSSTTKIKKAYGWDLIQHAGKGELQKVKSLIAAGTDVNARDKDGNTPLHYAAKYGNAKVVNALIAAGAHVDARDHQGNTPLAVAVDGRRVEAIQPLTAAGADVNTRNNEGETPLSRISLKWNVGHYGGSGYFEGGSYFVDSEMVKALIVGGVVANAWLLRQARDGHDYEAISDLIGAGADVDAFRVVYGKASIYMAAYYGNIEVVKSLIAAGDDVNYKSKSEYKWRPLNAAAARGHLEVVKALIAANADVNRGDIDGDRPLHQAAGNGNAEVVRALIAAGADVNKKNKSGERPLKIAIENRHAEVAGILKAAGAKR